MWPWISDSRIGARGICIYAEWPSDSLQAVVDEREEMMDDIVLAFLNNTNPLGLTTELRDTIGSRSVSLRIYEMSGVIFYFLSFNRICDESLISCILYYQCYVSAETHSVYFAFTRTVLLYCTDI